MGFPICDSIKSVLKLQFPQIRGTVIVIVFAGINRIGSGKYHVMNSIRPQAILLAYHVLRKHQLSFFGIIRYHKAADFQDEKPARAACGFQATGSTAIRLVQ